jgi:MFS family permease
MWACQRWHKRSMPPFSKSNGSSWRIVLAYLLVITTLIVSVGRFGDIAGRKRLLVIGVVVFTLGSALCGVAPTLGLLIAARAVQGFGAAIMMALTMTFVAETVPKEKTGSAMGLLGTMSAMGTALGPSLGGVLLTEFGWRAIFLANVPLGILAILLTHHYLPIDQLGPKTEGSNFDALGTLLLALALTLAAYALAMTNQVGGHGFGSLNIALLLVAAFGIGLFVLAETKAPSPLIQLATFRDPMLSSSFIINALVSTVMMTTLAVGPFYLARGLGFNQAQVGILMSIGPMISMLSGVPWGRLVDRFGVAFTVIVGLSEMVVGSIALSTLPAMFGITGYIAAIAILTPGYALFQAGNNTAVMKDINPDQRGVMSGLLGLSRNLGLITGASVMGAIFASSMSNINTARSEAVANGMRITFVVAAVLLVVALGIMVVIFRRALRARAIAQPAKMLAGERSPR